MFSVLQRLFVQIVFQSPFPAIRHAAEHGVIVLAKAPFVSLGPELSGEGGRGGSGPGECQNPLHGLVQAVDKSQVGLAAPGSRTIAALFPAVLQLTDHVLLSQPGSLHRKPGGLVRYDYIFVFIQDSTQHILCILHFVCIHTAKSFLCNRHRR